MRLDSVMNYPDLPLLRKKVSDRPDFLRRAIKRHPDDAQDILMFVPVQYVQEMHFLTWRELGYWKVRE